MVAEIHKAFPLQHWREDGCWTLSDAVTVVAVGSQPHFCDLVKDLMTVETCRESDRCGRLPLHLAICHGAPADVIQSLIKVLPEACGEMDAEGQLPIQYAIKRKMIDPDVLIALVGSHPDSGTFIHDLSFGGMQIGDAKAGKLISTLAQATSHSLVCLDMSGNRLTKLPSGISAINSLEKLDLRDNSITSLSMELLQLTRLTELALTGNSALRSVAEIGVSAGVEGVFAYLQDLYDDPEASFSLKVMLGGPTMAGKSSLLRALMRKAVTLTAVDVRTVGLDIERLVLEDPRALEGVRFLIYDAGGHDGYQEMHQPFVTEKTLYVIVWDVSYPRPGDDAFAVTEDIVRKQAQWATLIQTCAPGSTVLLVGSHADEVDDPACVEERCRHIEQRVCGELEKYRSVQIAEYEKLSVAQKSGPAAVARFRQLSQVLDAPLRVAGCQAVSAKTMDGLDALRRKLVELAFDKESFESFGEMQPGTYLKIHRYLLRAFPDKLTVTWAQIEDWALHPPDLFGEKIDVQSAGSTVGGARGEEYREYRYRVVILDETVKDFAVRYSQARGVHTRLKKAVPSFGAIRFPANRADAVRDMTLNEANVARRAEELRLYYQELLDMVKDQRLGNAVFDLPDFPEIDGNTARVMAPTALHQQYCSIFQKVQSDPELVRRAILYLRITGEVLWHDSENMPLLRERVFLKPQLLVDVMKELVRHDLGERIEQIDPAMHHAVEVQKHGRDFVKRGVLRANSALLPWLWKDLSDDSAQMEFLIELLSQHGLLTRLPSSRNGDPQRWLLPMRLPDCATLRLPESLLGVVTTKVSQRHRPRSVQDPESDSESTTAADREYEPGAKVARVAASIGAKSNVAGAIGAAMVALGKAGTTVVSVGLAAVVAPASAGIMAGGTAIAGIATTVAVTSAVVGWTALQQAPHQPVDILELGIRNGSPILECRAGSQGLARQLHDLGVSLVGLEPHSGLIYAHCITFAVWKLGQFSFTDLSDATYTKVCRAPGKYTIHFNSPDPTLVRVSSNADPKLVQQAAESGLSTVAAPATDSFSRGG
eukprot:SAG22_NODE_307_length_12666_cov_761.250259_10_plen_1050_part_00